LFWAVSATISCSHQGASPESVLDNVSQAFVRGELERSQSEAERGYLRFRESDPRWAWRLRIVEAKAALWRGLYENVIGLLSSPPPTSAEPDLAIPTLTLVGVANSYLHNFPEAGRALKAAQELCSVSVRATCGDLLLARGLLASEQAQSASALQFYRQSLSFARSRGDGFLESSSLLNLGAEALSQGYFDEAIGQSRAAYDVAKTLDASVVELVTQGNIAWAYYKLGDSERALEQLIQAEKMASRLGDISDQENELTNIGYIYMDSRKFDLAAQSFQRALEIARNIKAKQDIYNALRVLARLALQVGDPDEANDYAAQALKIAHESANRVDDLYPLLVQGQVAARRGDAVKARQIFETVEQDKVCPISLKWEAEHSRARLDEDQKELENADREYRAALATFEAARSTVRHEDFQLSFLTNAARIYDDYVHFLVSQGKTGEALRWADYSRARTLSEGLGLLLKGTPNAGHAGPPALNAREISRRANGVLLFYWLGEKQSYLWAITPQKTSLFPLPPAAEIESMVLRYRTALKGPQDVLESSNDGRALYRTLIAPATPLLANDTRVFIIPDGSLNNLNFETLVVPDPKPHYWIEDADVANASSLRVLAASFTSDARKKERAHRLLLIGDSVAPSKEYPELPRASQQMANVAKHFPATQEQIYQRNQATPSAYLTSNPEKFSHIHFVAHGTASRLSPLDSAIVLSRGAVETDSFKLYARDIVQHRLHADLVTISACYGAGERAYSGEGLVGLAWAFLRAGAHNVIAGLWDVTDASTEQLMDRFYDELDKGASPDAALRAAKLSLLRGSPFHNPFYWAPFQLYTAS
jgi:CHAT domain-containing protein